MYIQHSQLFLTSCVFLFVSIIIYLLFVIYLNSTA